MHALVHEALTGEEILPAGNQPDADRWAMTGDPDAEIDWGADAKARKILERVAGMPNGFDSLEVTAPNALAVFHEFRIDARHKILPQVVRQLQAISDAAAELADAIADGDRDQGDTRLEWARQTKTMLDSRIMALRQRRDVVSGIIRKICCGHRKAGALPLAGERG